MKFIVFLLSIILFALATGSAANSQQVPPVLGQSPPALSNQGTSNEPIIARVSQAPRALAQTPPAINGQALSMEQLTLQAKFQLELTILVTIFGIIGLIFVAMLFRSTIAADTDKIVRLIIVVIVVTASLILISGGYSTDQTAPAFGLFGSIIGYILGSARGQASGGGGAPASDNSPATANTPPAGNTSAPAGATTP
jgi:hypothetical protein